MGNLNKRSSSFLEPTSTLITTTTSTTTASNSRRRTWNSSSTTTPPPPQLTWVACKVVEPTPSSSLLKASSAAAASSNTTLIITTSEFSNEYFQPHPTARFSKVTENWKPLLYRLQEVFSPPASLYATVSASSGGSGSSMGGGGNRSFFTPGNALGIDRLQQEHYLFKMLFNGQNHLVSMDEIIQDSTQSPDCLDVGHGAGTWGLEMATSYPRLQVYGIDDACLNPTTVVPPNCRFLAHGLPDKPFPFHQAQFRYIHQQGGLLMLPTSELPGHFQELMRVLSPLGVLECIETDYLHHDVGTAGEQVNAWILELLLRQGVHVEAVAHLNEYIEKAGFEDCEMVTIRVPTGPWGQELGILAMDYFLLLLDSLKSLIVEWFVICEDEFDLIVQRWKAELCTKQSWWELKTCVARRT